MYISFCIIRKTYQVVENGEAGHGFTNEAYRGNLKITKDSSDGRKDGFAIEVKSADGSLSGMRTGSLRTSALIRANILSRRARGMSVSDFSNSSSHQ